LPWPSNSNITKLRSANSASSSRCVRRRKKAKDSAGDYRRRLDALKAEYDYMAALWGEFDDGLVRIADVELSTQKIAGVRTPVLTDVKFE